MNVHLSSLHNVWVLPVIETEKEIVYNRNGRKGVQTRDRRLFGLVDFGVVTSLALATHGIWLGIQYLSLFVGT